MSDAAVAYRRVITLAPGSRLAERAEIGMNRITSRGFREAGGSLRPDVLTYCGEALRLFEAMPADRVQEVATEIAMLGTKGLSVNDPSVEYTLRTLPGSFSGLQLLCFEYVGFKITAPDVDIGFDIEVEYEAAKRMRECRAGGGEGLVKERVGCELAHQSGLPFLGDRLGAEHIHPRELKVLSEVA